MAKGFIFISMEDETGIANIIVTPDLYERERIVVTRSRFLMVEGMLQNQDGVIHVKAVHLRRFQTMHSQSTLMTSTNPGPPSSTAAVVG